MQGHSSGYESSRAAVEPIWHIPDSQGQMIGFKVKEQKKNQVVVLSSLGSGWVYMNREFMQIVSGNQVYQRVLEYY